MKDRLKRELSVGDIVEQVVDDANCLKALEIIKGKKVEMALFNDSKTVEDYNHNRNWGANELTQEEFNLLKEVLE